MAEKNKSNLYFLGGNCGEKYKYHVLAAAVFGGFYFLFLAGVVVGGATTKIEANGTPGGRTGGKLRKCSQPRINSLVFVFLLFTI